MQQGEFPLVVRKSGRKLIPTFPVTLREGDRFILVQEVTGTQVPEGDTWIVEGYHWGAEGPLIPQHKVIKHE